MNPDPTKPDAPIAPVTITAVKCESCSKLIPADDEYLVINKVQAFEKNKDSADKWTKDRAVRVSITNKVVCDTQCFTRLLTKLFNENDR